MAAKQPMAIQGPRLTTKPLAPVAIGRPEINNQSGARVSVFLGLQAASLIGPPANQSGT